MTPIVEISAEGVAGVRADLVATRDALDGWGPLRHRAWALGVSTSGFDEALSIADRLDSRVLPVVDTHLARARALADLRYGGALGPAIPVIDDDPDPFAPVPGFAHNPTFDGGTLLTWAPAPADEHEVNEQDTETSKGIGDWFEDRWDDVTDAVDEGTDWVASTASDTWDSITDAGAAIGDWWESTTADLGGWIDANLAGVREWIGEHVGLLRFLASACRVIGRIVIVAGVVLTVGLAIIGAAGGGSLGAVFGFGVGAVPGGAAGAAAGAAFGLKVLGVGFSLLSVGDFLDVAADWGEGKIDGQDLVKQGSLELALAITSIAGAGAVGKILQKSVERLPASWRKKLDDWLKPLTGKGPGTSAEQYGPLRNGAPSGPGWSRRPDVEPDLLYGQPRLDFGPLNSRSQVPTAIDPDIQRLGGDLSDPWGTDPVIGRPFSQPEWEQRFVEGSGWPRWPPNRGAVPGSRIEFTDPDRFIETYGDQFDRVGPDSGDFLGVPPGATFGERALPPGHMKLPVHDYSFSGHLPPGVTIEVSEIAPAFGRPGGGIQVRFMNGDKALKIDQMLPAAPGRTEPFGGILQ
ncbi:TNT domain-containing protein [Cellulomonas sp. P5_C5]